MGDILLEGRLIDFYRKLIINKFDHVIVKSEKMKDVIKTKIPVSVIPNGVNFELFNTQSLIESRKKLGLNQNDFIVLFLGNPNDPIKNFNLAKRGYGIFKEFMYEEKIIFINPFGMDETLVKDYMNASDVLLVTSFYEGSPNVVKEAMACNLPIISTDVGDVKEIIKDTKNCFIVDFSTDEISKRLKIIYNNKGRSNGREKITFLSSVNIAKKNNFYL